MKRCIKIFILPLLLVMGISVLESRAEEPAIDPAATEILKRMTDYLGGLEQFSVHTQNTLEDRITSGHRVDLDVSAKVILSRPNKLRSERKGDKVNQVFYYDGKALTLYSPTYNVYATTPAPDTYYGLFQYLFESIGFGLPISDLVHSNAFELLMQDVSFAQIVGKTYIHGIKCDQLLFSRPGVDFQVWVAEGSKPLPLKYVVTDTAISPRLSVSTLLDEWDVEPKADNGQFTFVQPDGAQEIKFILF
jgi:hypothetical protein